MKRLLLALPLLFISCNEKETPTDFDERLLDLVIETRNGRTIALPDLYGKVFEIRDNKSESLTLTTKLQARGFTLLETRNDVQGFTGTRSVIQILSKDSCRCEVKKTYGRTAFVNQYDVVEQIKCE